MSVRYLLSEIPPEIQQRYNINAEAKAEGEGSVMGGHFTIETKDGGSVSMDAVELSGTDIKVKRL